MTDAAAPRAGRLDGGCPDCAAYTDVVDVGRGVLVLTVHHDDTCPDYRRRRAAGGTA